MRNPTKIVLLTLALATAPGLAQAQSRRSLEEARFIDGTIGAVAGALVGGPLGLIAGAAIGYSIGPEIAGPIPRLLTPARQTRRVARRRVRPAQYQQVQQQQYYQQPGVPMYMAQPGQAYPAGYPQQGYPQQVVPQAPGYDPQRQMFNPRQNPLVPSPAQMGGGAQYSAVFSGPNAAGQQGASGAYAGQPMYGQQPMYGGQAMAAPVPAPR